MNPGRALWRRLTAEFEAGELVILESACWQADDIARLEHAFTDDGIIVPGATGQPRLSACVTEVRQGRLALAKLLEALRLPAEDENIGKSARHPWAAKRRWAQVTQIEERRHGATQT